MHTLYHGTSSINLDSIKKAGLEPGHGHGGDQWATEHHMPTGRMSAKRGPQVFVAAYKDQAEDFANIAVEELGGEPVILVLHVPEKVFATFKVDELFENGGPANAWRAPHIPADCIGEVLPAKKHTPFNGTMDVENTLLSMLASLLAH